MKRRTLLVPCWAEKTITWMVTVALVASQISLPQIAEAAAPGSSTESAGSASPPSVTQTQSFQPDLFTGRATHSVPFTVPPGRKGVQPSLAASYASTAVNGWLGVGWALDLGFIELSTADGVPAYDGTDTCLLAFNGVTSELVELDDGSYRCREEGAFLRIVPDGTGGWEVTDKSGTKYFFGADAASRVENGANVFRWALDKVRDVNGNTMTIAYTHDQGQLYPEQILYTGHETTGLPPACRVDFVLEDRPDPISSYRSGFEIKTARRLKQIETYAQVSGAWSLAKRYVLDYTLSARTMRSLLRSVTTFGSDGVTSLPPMQFTYSDADQPTYDTRGAEGTVGAPAWKVRVAPKNCGVDEESHCNFGFVGPSLFAPGSCGQLVPVVTSTVSGVTTPIHTNATLVGIGNIDYAGPYRQMLLSVEGDAVCLADIHPSGPYSDYRIYDVTDRTNPTHVGTCSNWYGSTSTPIYYKTLAAAAEGKYVYVSRATDSFPSQFAIDVIDVSSCASPVKVGEWSVSLPAMPLYFNMAVANGVVYVPASHQVHAIDFTDPGTPHQIGVAEMMGGGGFIDVAGDLLYVVGSADGENTSYLSIYSLSGGSEYSSLSATPLNENCPQGIVVEGAYAYVQRYCYVDIINVSNPQEPYYVATYTPEGCCGPPLTWGISALDVQGRYLYVGLISASPNTPARFEVVDVLDPASPVLVAKAGSGNELGFHYVDLKVQDDYVYAQGYDALAIYRVPWSKLEHATPGTSMTVDPDGAVDISSARDHFVHAWTHVFCDSDRTIDFTPSGNWDVASLWITDRAGLHGPYASGDLGAVPVKQGWSGLHMVGYNQHQDFSMGLASALTSQVDIVSAEPYLEPLLTGDVDGDGASDLISYRNGTWHRWPWFYDRPRVDCWTDGSGYAGCLPDTDVPGDLEVWLDRFGDEKSQPMIGDWDHDGRADPGLWEKSGYWRLTGQNPRYSTCVRFYPLYRPLPPYAEEGIPIVGDFNGDGVPDLGAFDAGTWHVGIGDGDLEFTKTPSFDLYMAGGDPPLPPHDVRWTIRRASQDAQHDNYGSYPPYLQPWAGSPWTTTVAGEGTYDLGYTHATVAANGDLWMWVEKDHVMWAMIAVYMESAKDINVGHELSWDTAQFFIERPGEGLEAHGLAATVPLQRGWSLLHVTVYNENQQGEVGLLPNLTEQVDMVALEMNVDLQRPAVVTGDFNGDGLTDVGVAYDGVVHVAFSDGTHFLPRGGWTVGWGTNEYFSADFNGDGRTDIAGYDHETGRIKVALCNGQGFEASTELPLTFSLRDETASPQIGDFNGDGIADPALFNPYTGAYELSFSQGLPPDLLTHIENGIGGQVDIAYGASSMVEGEGMAVVVPLVQSVTTHDGMGNSYATTYTYHDGQFDYEVHQFRGFRQVDVRDPLGRVKTTEFHQDDYRKGRIWRTESRDVSTNLWSRIEHLWESASPYPETDAVYTRLIQVDNFTYEGDASFKQTRTRQIYDDVGNIVTTYADGDVSILGDEHYTTSLYASNETDWIMNKAYLTQLYDASGSATGEARLAGQSRIYYDGSTVLGQAPTKGLATRDEKWLDQPVETWVTSTAEYDTYGNTTSMTGPDGNSVMMTCDAVAETYVARTVSPLGHETVSTHDPRHGKVLSATDVNGVTRSTEYDPLGRMRFAYVTDPGTGQTHLGAEAQYDDAIFPRHEVQTVYALPGQGSPMTTYTFFDGMGRQIQQRAPAETPGQQIVTGHVVHDEAGRSVQSWPSVFAPFSDAYVQAPDGGLPPTEFFYEPGGRLTKTRFSDGNETTMTFDDWTTTAIDAKGHTATIYMDAYGRTIRKEEINGVETIVTRYEYDATDHILRIIDHAGHIISNAYDSLGRKIETDDPDMGRTSFEYDVAGRLTAQVDARGITQHYFYDNIGRIIRRSCEVPPTLGLPPQGDITYAYDAESRGYSTGKLTDVNGPGYSASYTYDYMGRLVQDTKTIAGQTYAYSRTFDLRGRMLTVEYPNSDSVAYTYNTQDGVESVTLLPVTGGSEPIVSSVTYNAANQITQMVHGNGTVADYSFNPLTLRLDRIQTTMGAIAIQDLSYTYDPVGNISAITDTVGTRTQAFQYDNLNRLLQASGDYGIFNYAYDALGNILEKEGLTMSYGEGGAGPHAVTARSDGLAMSYDAVGNMIGKDSTVEGADRTFTYDADNRLIVVSKANEEAIPVVLDSGWNLVSFPTAYEGTPVTQLLSEFGINYSQLTRCGLDSATFTGFINDPAQDQFDTVAQGEGYWLYVTAPTGMVQSLVGVGVSQEATTLDVGWNLLPGPISTMTVSKWLGTLVQSVDYGAIKGAANGVLVSADEVYPGKSYFVEILRNCTWTPPTAGIIGDAVSFAYDHEGSRIQKTSSAGTHTYVGVMYEVGPDGKTTMYFQAAGRRVASKSSDGVILYYHMDHLGSVQTITDASGNVVEDVEYQPFGKIHKRVGSVNVPQKFTGQRLDLETDLHYYKARYYDADLGRFITPDLVIQSVGDSQALNPYSYCRNNPVNNSDPSGHFFGAFMMMKFLSAVIYGAFMGGFASTVAALFTGQDVGTAFQNGALAGAVGGAFGYMGAAAMGKDLLAQDFAVRALFDAAGDATLAAIQGESSSQILKAAYQSLITSAANYGVGRFSGWSNPNNKARIFENDMRRPGTREIQVLVPGIGNEARHAFADMYYHNYDFAIWNPTANGAWDLVECAQDLLFGPGTASISTGHKLAELGTTSSSQGKKLVLVFHSQGTITGTLGMLTMSSKLPDGTEVTFRRQPMPLVGRFMAVSSHGASHTSGGSYIPRQMGDIVTAIGNPQYWPTALFTALSDYGPWGNGIWYYHCDGALDPPARLVP